MRPHPEQTPPGMGPRDAYLHVLRAELADLPPPVIADIVADFAAHFAEARAAGRSESDAARRLGDVVWLAHELRETVAA